MIKFTNSWSTPIGIPYNNDVVFVQPGDSIYITPEQLQYLKDKCPDAIYTTSIDNGTPPSTFDSETQILCDVQANGTQTEFWAIPVFNELTGIYISTRYATLTNISIDYTPTGIVKVCKIKSIKSREVCLPDGRKFMACMQVLDGVGLTASTIYILPNGQSANLTAGEIGQLDFCKPPVPITNTITGGGSPWIAGSLINSTGLGTEFDGAPDSVDTSIIPGQLQSITIIAKGVKDGRKEGLTQNQIIIDCPDGTSYPATNGTYTYQIQKDTDTELRREYKIRAIGKAYANIIYTFI